ADLRAVLARAANGVIEDLPGKLAGCPAAMAAVLGRALDPEPHRRGSAAEFALDLGASVPSAPVVLAAGRILPGVGRHSAERHHPAGLAAVPADLTHVARLHVRPEPDEPLPGRHPLRGLVDRTAGRLSATLLIAVLSVALLAITALVLAAVRSKAQPVAAGQRPARAAGPAQAAGPGSSAAVLEAGRSGEANPTSTAGGAVDGADPAAVLRRLADRRAAAFAGNRPDLLAALYQSPALLAQDLSQLSSRVPAGCVLTGLRTSYRDVTVTGARPQQLEVRVTASQPSASLVCAGTVRGRTEPAGPTRLVLRLVRVGAEFRIASQRPGG
ncbi:MAG TPA: hypothetical protein VF542_14925, partial [Jatrophihabitans sp.]